MVYDKAHISLFASGDPLPKMLAWIEKRDKALRLVLSQQVGQRGTLFAFCGGKYLYASICARVSSIPLDGFEFGADYFLAFYPDDPSQSVLVGEKGRFPRAKLLEKFSLKLANLKSGAAEPELNLVVDNMMKKMFGFLPTAFFDQTKPQLVGLFSSARRAKELEDIFPSSKFIFAPSGGEDAFVGIIYRDKVPYALGIGYRADEHIPLHEGAFQFVFDKQDVKKGYFLLFKRVADGDNVIIAAK